MSLATFRACYLPLLAEFAPDRDVRYYLNGFYVTPAHASVGGVYLIATNGHTAVVIHDKEGTAEAPGIYPVPKLLVSKCAPLRGRSAAKAEGRQKMIHLDGRMALLTLGEGLEEHDIAVSCRPIDGKYPDVRRILGVDFEKLQPVKHLQINAGYLAKLSKLTILGGHWYDRRFAGVRMVAASEESAVFCVPDIPDHRVYVVIMPMRIDTALTDQHWLTEFRTKVWDPPKEPQADGFIVMGHEADGFEAAVAAADAAAGGAQ